ncbi:MAG TPA: hypothetical protein VKV39_03670 [Candidatus Sulfotelmatobacter sp.]|nr:hypothetical protein [Candidatus Sulfotelmatobacter sp.]
MRLLKFFGIFLLVLGFTATAVAGENHYGIRDRYDITFISPVRIGDTLLPAGQYTIRHTMQGDTHIMVFQSENRKVAEVKAECKLVPLPKKADRTQTLFATNAAKELVLQELVFRGDSAKHVF